MNCRRFNNQLADWQTNRLSPEAAFEMVAHRDTCPSCAQAAQLDANLRERWREARVETASPDLWPRIALHLDTPPQEKHQAARVFRTHQRAWAAALVLVGVMGFGLTLGPKEFSGLPHSHGTVNSGPVGTNSTAGAAVLSVMSNTTQVDPAVDDPAGTSMENVWTQINTRSAAKASSE